MRRTIQDVLDDIKQVKKERKKVARHLGKCNTDYIELCEELDVLKDELSFKHLHDEET